MSFVIDILLVVLVGFVIYRAASKGFISTVLDTLSVFISAIVAKMFSAPVAEKCYDMFVHDLVRTRFIKVLDELSSAISIREKVLAMIDGLPPMAVKLAEASGVDMSSLANSVSVAGNATDEQIADIVVDKIGYTIMINITEVLIFLVLFILVALLIRFVSKFFENTNKIPLVGKLNSVLGGAIGVVKAIVILVVVCTGLFIIASASDPNPLVDGINGSTIYTYLIENNPFLDLIK